MDGFLSAIVLAVLAPLALTYLVLAHLELTHLVFDPHQYGSLKGSCTTFALLELTHKWFTWVEPLGQAVRILLLDFRKAFDLVDHRILLSKMANAGIPNFILRWCKSFLHERQQRIKIGDVHSEWVQINAGVPQGTLLGPVCFLIHINDLKTSNEAVKYVDDTTIHEACSYTGEGSTLQMSADQAIEWAEKNNMAINTDKTKEVLIYFGKKPHSIPNISIKGQSVSRVDDFKLLGVHFNNKLTWDNHVDAICSKASRRLFSLSLLRRAGKSPEDLTDVYCSTIRSVLEYAAEVWHPGLTIEQSNCIEHIQERAMKIIYPTVSYTTAIKKSDLEFLSHRRETLCKKLFEKMSNDDHKLNHLLPKSLKQRDTRTKTKFELPKCRTKRNKNSPLNYLLYKFQHVY